jgi:hypothetical protein
MALRQMLEKASHATFLREMIGFAAQRLMVGEVTRAAHGEGSTDRLVQRNGDRDRDWQTQVGTVELRIPKLPVRAASRSNADSPKVTPGARTASRVAGRPLRPAD